MNNFQPIISAISPLEQFDIHPIFVLNFLVIKITITNLNIFLLIAVLVILSLLGTPLHRYKIIPTSTQIIVEKIYDFVYGIVYENLSKNGRTYFPLLLCLFVYIVTINLIGIIPYTFTPTSHIGVAFGLSFSFFIGFTILGISLHKIEYSNNFFPDDTPYEMSPLLVPIEIISHISKAFSLGIRLFANMMSGHALLKIIAGFVATMVVNGGILAVASIIPFLLLFALTGLETGIAVLQGYVFTVLCTLYTSDSINVH